MQDRKALLRVVHLQSFHDSANRLHARTKISNGLSWRLRGTSACRRPWQCCVHSTEKVIDSGYKAEKASRGGVRLQFMVVLVAFVHLHARTCRNYLVPGQVTGDVGDREKAQRFQGPAVPRSGVWEGFFGPIKQG